MSNSQLTNRINALLAEKGIDKRTFYKNCKITSSAYSQWATGKTAPRLKKLIEIAEYLDVPVSCLTGPAVGGQKEKPAPDEGNGLTEVERAVLEAYRNDADARARIDFEVDRYKKNRA